MPNAASPRIHPTAVISPEAELADDVQIGPFAWIEGRVKIGPGCVIRGHVHLCGPLTMGSGNWIGSGAVLGERPQHFKYNDEPTGVAIGDNNVIREHVTIHRATTHSWVTRIGDNNLLMVGAHVAHDCQVGSRCILANGALLGGHCLVADSVYLSGNCAVHQFCQVGRLALLSGCSTSTKDIPPFIMQNGINRVVGLNLVGMRRAGMNAQQIQGLRRAYQLLYREQAVIPAALAAIDKEVGDVDVVAELVEFIRRSQRGICLMHDDDKAAA